MRRSSPLCLLASFLCSFLDGDLLVGPGEFSLHRVQPVIESHQLVYLQSTSDATVEIPIAKERRREAYNKQAGSLKLRMSPFRLSETPKAKRTRQRHATKFLACQMECAPRRALSSPLSSRARRSLPLQRQSTPSARRRPATGRLRRGSRCR